MPARPSLIVTLIVAALPLGCGGRAEMLADPTKYQFYNCTQLAGEMKTLREHAQELRTLQERAARDAAGAFIAKVTYEPDYLSTVGNMEVIEATAQEKNCNPPVTAGGAPGRR